MKQEQVFSNETEFYRSWSLWPVTVYVAGYKSGARQGALLIGLWRLSLQVSFKWLA